MNIQILVVDRQGFQDLNRLCLHTISLDNTFQNGCYAGANHITN